MNCNMMLTTMAMMCSVKPRVFLFYRSSFPQADHSPALFCLLFSSSLTRLFCCISIPSNDVSSPLFAPPSTASSLIQTLRRPQGKQQQRLEPHRQSSLQSQTGHPGHRSNTAGRPLISSSQTQWLFAQFSFLVSQPLADLAPTDNKHQILPCPFPSIRA